LATSCSQAGLDKEQIHKLAAVATLLMVDWGEACLRSEEMPGFEDADPAWLYLSQFWWLPEKEPAPS
jgi:hypothetical protein